MSISDEELDAMMKRCEAATPAPLGTRLGSGNYVCTALASKDPSAFDEFVCDVLPDYACLHGKAPRWEANREFIRAAYSDLPRVIQALKEERARNEKLDKNTIRVHVDLFEELKEKAGYVNTLKS